MSKNYSIRANASEAERIELAITEFQSQSVKDLLFTLIDMIKESVSKVSEDLINANDDLINQKSLLEAKILELENTSKNPLAITVVFQSESQKQSFEALMVSNNLTTPLQVILALHNHVKKSLFKDLKA